MFKFKIVLEKLFVVASFVLMILGVYFAYLEYTLFRVQVGKQNDPLIQYSYIDDKEAFVVSGGSDVEIKEVAWSIPSLATEALTRLNKHPRILTLQDLITELYHDSTYIFSELSPDDLRYIVKCHILGNSNPLGIPLIAEVTFRQRGEGMFNTTSSLVYAEWLSSENPFIEVYEADASEEDTKRFFKKSLSELRDRFMAATEPSVPTVNSSASEDLKNKNCFVRS